jgi:hypothetical protein
MTYQVVRLCLQVCRQASYYGHALYLAEKFQQNDWYLKIQLEDNKDYQKALDYIGKLEFEAVGFSSVDMYFGNLPKVVILSSACFPIGEFFR